MKPLIVLLTDFGQRDGYVGVMKGVIHGIAPEARVVDLSHDIPPQDIAAAAFVLWQHHRFFPTGTIFCCVVDPGVGTDRAALAVQTEHAYFIAPDNGLLDFVLSETPARQMLRIEHPKIVRETGSSTFHGRDIFAPAAAQLAADFLYTQIGPLHSYRLPASPFRVFPPAPDSLLEILHIDHFGNLITNLRLEPDQLADIEAVSLAGQTIRQFGSTYATVESGALLGLIGSHGLFEIARRDGNAARALAASRGQTFDLKLK